MTNKMKKDGRFSWLVYDEQNRFVGRVEKNVSTLVWEVKPTVGSKYECWSWREAQSEAQFLTFRDSQFLTK